MILIVSWPGDDHARAVQAELEGLGAGADVLDLARFPQELAVAIRYDDGSRSYDLLAPDEEVRLDRYRAVWWRRPRPFELHPEVARGRYGRWAYQEAVEAFAGLWQCLDAAWVNHPTRDEVAARKVLQLRVAQELGLEIPTTLVTNDPEEARRFIADRRGGGVAYKAFLPAPDDWRETRVAGPGELAEIAAVRYAPVIFQEYVPVSVDLRVTVVGDEVFATAIHSRESRYEADYRMDLDGARVEPFALPAALRDRLQALVRRLGLVYGAVDLRRTPDGRFVFFEINPAGEWRFVEERSGQPITAAVARVLANRAGAAPAARPRVAAGAS